MSRHRAPEPETPQGLTIHRLIEITMGQETDFSGRGGYGGSCWGCPFASEQLDGWTGRPAEYSSYANDPSEALFRCSLPTRTPGTSSLSQVPGVEWGEYAPCTQEQWVALLVQVIPDAPIPTPVAVAS